MSQRRKSNCSLSVAQERYIESIADAENGHGHAHISLLAEALRVSKPSVVQMVGRLEKKGIVQRDGKEVMLTSPGKRIAGDLRGRHRLLQQFMEDRLGMNPRNANEEACRLEHVVSAGFIRGLRCVMRDDAKP